MHIQSFAEKLDNAALHARAVRQLSLDHRITLSDAYDIQQQSMERRYMRGESLIGSQNGIYQPRQDGSNGCARYDFGAGSQIKCLLITAIRLIYRNTFIREWSPSSASESVRRLIVL